MQISNARPWLKKRLLFDEAVFETKRLLESYALNTVCESGLCPNLNECFSRAHATFLILGNGCTRSCAFCSVSREAPGEIDRDEPNRIASAVKRLGLKYVVITSVTRDDLDDGGAEQFSETLKAIKGFTKGVKTEVLVPDFRGSRGSVEKIVLEYPEVFSHNIETVRRLYPFVRRGSDYERSLDVLRFAKEISPVQITKSSVMIGLGEDRDEVTAAMKDLRQAGCDILNIGQYLRPGNKNIEVKRYIDPEEFIYYKKAGEDMGFGHVSAATFVRSSYLAEEGYAKASKCQACRQAGMEDDHEGCYYAADSRRCK